MDDYEAEENAEIIGDKLEKFFEGFMAVLRNYVKPGAALLLILTGLALNSIAMTVLRKRLATAFNAVLSTVAFTFFLYCVFNFFLAVFKDLFPSTKTTFHPYMMYWIGPLISYIDSVAHWAILLLAYERYQATAIPQEGLRQQNYKLYLTVISLVLLPVSCAQYLINGVENFGGGNYYTIVINYRLAFAILGVTRAIKSLIPGYISLGFAVKVWLMRRNMQIEGVVRLQEEEEEEVAEKETKKTSPEDEETGNTSEPKVTISGRFGDSTQSRIRQAALTDTWLKMAAFHAASEILPTFLLITHDLPLLIGGFGATFMPINLVIVLYNVMFITEQAKAAFTALFFFTVEVKAIGTAWIARVKSCFRK